MSIMRATVVLNKKSGVPKDAARNVWHFFSPTADLAAVNFIGSALAGFYTNFQLSLSPAIAHTANAHRIEVAEVIEGGPGEGDDVVSSLIGTYLFGTTGVDTTATNVLPNEVACVLSFRGDIAGVPEENGLLRPRSRRRGRVYLGPLKPNTVGVAPTTMEPRFTTAFRESVLDAYDALTSSLASSDAALRHTVYSRADGENRIVAQVSVDSEPDVVRRRGRKPELRTARSVTQGLPVGSRDGAEVALAS